MASRLQFISISLEYLQQRCMVALGLHALHPTLDRVPSLSYNQYLNIGVMELRDFRFWNADLRFKSLETHSKESMESQSAI